MSVKIYDQDNPSLVNSMVCAIDILGFSQMILDSCKEGYGDKLLKEIWDKYVWTANCHNYFCDLHFPEEKWLKIAKKDLLSCPRQILNSDI